MYNFGDIKWIIKRFECLLFYYCQKKKNTESENIGYNKYVIMKYLIFNMLT